MNTTNATSHNSQRTFLSTQQRDTQPCTLHTARMWRGKTHTHKKIKQKLKKLTFFLYISIKINIFFFGRRFSLPAVAVWPSGGSLSFFVSNHGCSLVHSSTHQQNHIVVVMNNIPTGRVYSTDTSHWTHPQCTCPIWRDLCCHKNEKVYQCCHHWKTRAHTGENECIA